MDQEGYLKEATFKTIMSRAFKKVLSEMTSVKFLLLCFVCVGIALKWITDAVGLGTALVLVGFREVPVDAIVSKLTGKLTK